METSLGTGKEAASLYG